MQADQTLRGTVHGFCIKRWGDLPALAFIQRQWRPPVSDLVHIAATAAGKAGVPFVIYFNAS